MKAAIGSVQKLAQTELKLKRKHIADERAASYWWERSLEKVAESDKASKHHKTLEVIGKLWVRSQAHKAFRACLTDCYECGAEAGVAVIGGGTALLETEQGSP